MEGKINKTFERDDEPQRVISELLGLAENRNYVYRGYNKENEMLPVILRDSTFVLQEWNMLREFEKYGSAYFKAFSNIDFMSYAQHYGLPTRLLDFTENPLIALMFSMYQKKEDDDNYYHIAVANLNDSIVLKTIPLRRTVLEQDCETALLLDKAQGSIEDIEKIMNGDSEAKTWIEEVCGLKITEDSEEALDTKIKRGVLLFIKPNQANQRIVFQQGLFMLPYTLNDETLKNKIKEYCGEIRIHKDLRANCIRLLEACGINLLKLMPDLGSICNYIKMNNSSGS